MTFSFCKTSRNKKIWNTFLKELRRLLYFKQHHRLVSSRPKLVDTPTLKHPQKNNRLRHERPHAQGKQLAPRNRVALIVCKQTICFIRCPNQTTATVLHEIIIHHFRRVCVTRRPPGGARVKGLLSLGANCVQTLQEYTRREPSSKIKLSKLIIKRGSGRCQSARWKYESVFAR